MPIRGIVTTRIAPPSSRRGRPESRVRVQAGLLWALPFALLVVLHDSR